jgi:HNH endonuclease
MVGNYNFYMRKPNATCCKCGDPCYVRPSVFLLQDNWYCSKTCYTEARFRKAARYCAHCGKPLIKKSTEAKFCSVNCSNKSRAGIEYTGENSLNKVERHKRVRRLMIKKYGEVCNWCGGGNIWNERPLTLQIDHMDGDRRNWSLENLRFLCPNCHSQTETFGVRKVRS